MTGAARRLRVVGIALLGAACVAVVAGILNPGAAGAAGSHVRIEVVGSGDGFTQNPTRPLVDTRGLVPGQSATGTMGVVSDFADPADFSVRLVDVVDEDNGCTPAERAVDPNCGSGPGDLAAALTFSIAVSTSQSGTYVPTWTGNAAELTQGVAATQGVEAGVARWVRLTVNLPTSTGNAVQTDTYGFGVRVTAQTDSGSGSVEIGNGNGNGNAGGNGAGSGGAANSGHGPLGLAFTGTQAAMLVGAGVLLVAGGILLVASGSVRRRVRSGIKPGWAARVGRRCSRRCAAGPPRARSTRRASSPGAGRECRGRRRSPGGARSIRTSRQSARRRRR